MNAKVNDIIKIMESIAPHELSEQWDNTGFLVGHKDMPVKKIMVALDASPEVVEQAVAQNVQMLITHHPIIFKAIKSVRDCNWQQKLLLTCIENKIAVYSAHTNLDSVMGGVNDVLTDKLDLQMTSVLSKETIEDTGIGRIGFLSKEMTLQDFAERVKRVFSLDYLLVADAGKQVKKVAICGGAGADFIADALAAGADTYITGDVKYHEVQDAAFGGLNIIDAGHQGLEIHVVAALADKIALRLAAGGWATQVVSAKETPIFKQY